MKTNEQRNKKSGISIKTLTAIIEAASPIKPPEMPRIRHYAVHVPTTHNVLARWITLDGRRVRYEIVSMRKTARRQRIEARWALRRRERAMAKARAAGGQVVTVEKPVTA